MTMSTASSQTNRNPTINDVASRAGVSKKTVSRVINRLPGIRATTRERVDKAIIALGYVPNPQARALALGRNCAIVLLHDNPNAQTVQIFERGILDAIRESELALMVRPVDRHSPGMLDDIETFFRQQRPIGAIILPPISERDDIGALCRSMGVRFVRVGSAALDDDDHSVTSTDKIAVTEACQLLLAMGHRRIGFVRGPQGFRSAAERELGFHAALEASGVPTSPDYHAQGDYRFESGRSAGRHLLGLDPRPTAIFASNDEMAAGVMHAAFERNLQIPRDLSLVGFDDSPTATHVWPSLTTVRWPIRDMGMLAAEKLVGDFLLWRRFSTDSVHLSSELIERASVAPPPDA